MKAWLTKSEARSKRRWEVFKEFGSASKLVPKGPDLHALILVSHLDITNQLYGPKAWSRIKQISSAYSQSRHFQRATQVPQSSVWTTLTVPIANSKDRDKSDSHHPLLHWTEAVCARPIYSLFGQEHAENLGLSWGQEGAEHRSPASSTRRITNQKDTVPNCGHQKQCWPSSSTACLWLLCLVLKSVLSMSQALKLIFNSADFRSDLNREKHMYWSPNLRDNGNFMAQNMGAAWIYAPQT